MFNQENRGLSISRNKGLELAKSDYVYFLDSDDLLQENALDILFKNSSNTTQIISAKIATTNGHNNDIVGFLKHPENICNSEINTKYKVLLLAIEHGLTCTVQNRLIKKDFLIKNQIIFKEKILHEDELFFFEIFYHASDIKYIDEVTYYYNIGNDNSITKNFTFKNLDDCLIIIKEIYSKYYLNNMSEGKEITAIYLTNFKRLVVNNLKKITVKERNKIALEIVKTFRETKVIRNKKLLNNGFEKRLNQFHVVSKGSLNLISKYQNFVNDKNFFNSIFAKCIFYYSLIKYKKTKNFNIIKILGNGYQHRNSQRLRSY